MMKVKTKRRLIWFNWTVVFGILVLLALYFTGPLRWLGGPTVAILSHPTTVETFKIDGLHYQHQEAMGSIAGYSIVARGQTLHGSEATGLGHALLSPGDYVFGKLSIAACRISPGVGFRFWQGKQSVDVAVCFLCGHVVVDTRDAQGNVIHRYLAPFGVQRLTGFVQRAFPNDPDMQGALSMYEGREK